MSKEIKYYCNLCKENKPYMELMCLYFKCDVLPQQYVLITELDKSDKHICNDCIQVVKKFNNQPPPKGINN